MTEINLKEWDLKLPNHFSMLIYGSRRCGKSTICKHIIESNKLNDKYDHIICMSKNKDTLNDMSEYISGDLFFNEFNSQILLNTCKVSEDLEYKGNTKTFLIILDDVNGKDSKYDEHVNNVYSMGRHMNISIIWITQHITNINPSNRNNSDIILIGRMNTSTEKKQVMDHFLMGTRDEDMDNNKTDNKVYRILIKKYTENFKFIVIDNTTSTNDFNDVIKHVRKN